MSNRRIDATRRFRTYLGILGAAVLFVAANSSQAAAQFPGGGGFGVPASRQLNNPAVSPFLNLVQPGIIPGIAYQTLVAPQMQLSNAFASQQQQIGNLQLGLAPPRAPALEFPVTPSPQTGHATTFLNTLDYFPLAANARRH